MPTLTNPKHERFAQLLAKGKTADEAYAEAGYRPHRGNAATLRANQSISDRLAELLERAAQRTEITVAGITERLIRIADMAEKTGVTKDADTGEVVGTSSKHLTVARTALMDAAKLNGLVTDKTELTGKDGGPIELTDQEAAARIAAILEAARQRKANAAR